MSLHKIDKLQLALKALGSESSLQRKLPMQAKKIKPRYICFSIFYFRKKYCSNLGKYIELSNFHWKGLQFQFRVNLLHLRLTPYRKGLKNLVGMKPQGFYENKKKRFHRN